MLESPRVRRGSTGVVRRSSFRKSTSGSTANNSSSNGNNNSNSNSNSNSAAAGLNDSNLHNTSTDDDDDGGKDGNGFRSYSHRSSVSGSSSVPKKRADKRADVVDGDGEDGDSVASDSSASANPIAAEYTEDADDESDPDSRTRSAIPSPPLSPLSPGLSPSLSASSVSNSASSSGSACASASASVPASAVRIPRGAGMSEMSQFVFVRTLNSPESFASFTWRFTSTAVVKWWPFVLLGILIAAVLFAAPSLPTPSSTQQSSSSSSSSSRTSKSHQRSVMSNRGGAVGLDPFSGGTTTALLGGFVDVFAVVLRHAEQTVDRFVPVPIPAEHRSYAHALVSAFVYAVLANLMLYLYISIYYFAVYFDANRSGALVVQSACRIGMVFLFVPCAVFGVLFALLWAIGVIVWVAFLVPPFIIAQVLHWISGDRGKSKRSTSSSTSSATTSTASLSTHNTNNGGSGGGGSEDHSFSENLHYDANHDKIRSGGDESDHSLLRPPRRSVATAGGDGAVDGIPDGANAQRIQPNSTTTTTATTEVTENGVDFVGARGATVMGTVPARRSARRLHDD